MDGFPTDGARHRYRIAFFALGWLIAIGVLFDGIASNTIRRGYDAFNDDGTKFTSAVTDGNGFYTLVVQPSGYRVGAYDTSLQYARRFYPNMTTFSSAPHWTAFASQSTTINLALPRGARISGQVTAGGSALPAMSQCRAARRCGTTFAGRANEKYVSRSYAVSTSGFAPRHRGKDVLRIVRDERVRPRRRDEIERAVAR